MKREAIGPHDAQYICTFRAEPEGGYTVRCAAFPEIVSFGETLEDAHRAMHRGLSGQGLAGTTL
jgi:hypothetical protein